MLKMKRKNIKREQSSVASATVSLRKKKKKEKDLLWPQSTFSSKTVLWHRCTTKRQKPATCDLKHHFHVSLLLFTGQNFFRKSCCPLKSTQQLVPSIFSEPKRTQKRHRQIWKKISSSCSTHLKYATLEFIIKSLVVNNSQKPLCPVLTTWGRKRTRRAPTDRGNFGTKLVGSCLSQTRIQTKFRSWIPAFVSGWKPMLERDLALQLQSIPTCDFPTGGCEKNASSHKKKSYSSKYK